MQASAELTSGGVASMAAEEVVGNWLAMKDAVAAKQAQVLAAGACPHRSILHSLRTLLKHALVCASFLRAFWPRARCSFASPCRLKC